MNTSSPTYVRAGCHESNYFYETIEVKVIETGNYSLGSNSTIDTYGYIYNNSFDPFHLTMNLLIENDQSYGNNQFKLVTPLQVNTTYILVVTTYSPNVTGKFSVLVIGPNNVIFNHISKYLSFSLDMYHRITKYRMSLSLISTLNSQNVYYVISNSLSHCRIYPDSDEISLSIS